MNTSKLRIKTKNQSYNVIVGNNLIKNLLKILNDNLMNFNKCLLVIDNKVPKKFIIKINSLFKKKEKFFYLHQDDASGLFPSSFPGVETQCTCKYSAE